MADIVHELRDRAYSSKIVDRLCERAADEIARLRLTDEEREAVAWAAGWLSGGRADPPACGKDALWSLLERMK